MPVCSKLKVNIIPACAGIIALVLSSIVHAKPWISPNDPFLRADIQLLADIGIIKSPVTTWPLNWSGIKRDLFDARELKLTKYQNEVRQRVLRRCKYETRDGSRKKYGVSASANQAFFNGFGDEVRDGIQLKGNTDWLGKRFALNMQAATVIDPQDGDQLRFDGSYVAVVLDNWIISAGAEHRWWGAGWSDSLLIGSGARSLPAISIRRNHSSPSEHTFLNWFGVWHFDGFVARLESEREVENPLLLGMRFSFKPFSQLEVALSRLSMFGGGENPSDVSAFFSAVRADDDIDGEIGAVYSLNGIDIRYSFGSYLALYGQAAVTNGGQGSGDLGLIGVDFSLGCLKSGARGWLEVVDTDHRGNGINNYLGVNYQSGFYYKKRPIGSLVFGSSATVGALLPLDGAGIVRLSLKFAELIGGDAYGQSQEDVDLGVLNIGYKTQMFRGELKAGMQLYSEDIQVNGYDAQGFSLSLGWQKGI